MPDITLCRGEGCTIKEECYRHTAKPSERQAYFVEPPFTKKMGGTACENYMCNRKSQDFIGVSNEARV
jgi:metallophosphoesterase superfamily enzyme